MCLCDLLLAGVMETFSPKSDQSMEVNWKEKYNFLFFIRKKVLLLNFKTIEFCFLINEVLKESRGGGVCSISPPLCGEDTCLIQQLLEML